MRAEIVSVGTELLLGQIVDTNAARLCQDLSALGIAVYRRTTVGDNHDRLLAALNAALAETTSSSPSAASARPWTTSRETSLPRRWGTPWSGTR
jgi:molybdopterin biosynthesis enzyme